MIQIGEYIGWKQLGIKSYLRIIIGAKRHARQLVQVYKKLVKGIMDFRGVNNERNN